MRRVVEGVQKPNALVVARKETRRKALDEISMKGLWTEMSRLKQSTSPPLTIDRYFMVSSLMQPVGLVLQLSLCYQTSLMQSIGLAPGGIDTGVFAREGRTNRRGLKFGNGK